MIDVIDLPRVFPTISPPTYMLAQQLLNSSLSSPHVDNPSSYVVYHYEAANKDTGTSVTLCHTGTDTLVRAGWQVHATRRHIYTVTLSLQTASPDISVPLFIPGTIYWTRKDP